MTAWIVLFTKVNLKEILQKGFWGVFLRTRMVFEYFQTRLFSKMIVVLYSFIWKVNHFILFACVLCEPF